MSRSPGQPAVRHGIESVFDRERSAVGEADDVQRRRRTGASTRFAHREPRRGVPVFPLDIGQCRRHCAVPGQPDADSDKAAVAIAPSDVAQAVGCVGQAMQQHHGADRRSVGLEDIGAVPVLLEIARVDRAAGKIAIAGVAAFLLELVDDFGADVAKERVLGLEVGRPVGLVDFRRTHLVRHVGMPELQRRPALGIICAHGKKSSRRPRPSAAACASETGTTSPSWSLAITLSRERTTVVDYCRTATDRRSPEWR